MRSLLNLMVILGIWTAGWMKLDSASKSSAEAVAPESKVSAAPKAVVFNPAREAQVQAMTIYPGLARANSGLNQKFLDLYEEAKFAEPELLARADWPLQLADRAVVEMGGAPLPRPVELASTSSTESFVSALAAKGSSLSQASAEPVARVRSWTTVPNSIGNTVWVYSNSTLLDQGSYGRTYSSSGQTGSGGTSCSGGQISSSSERTAQRTLSGSSRSSSGSFSCSSSASSRGSSTSSRAVSGTYSRSTAPLRSSK